jgi:hypothetical protein
VAVVAVVFVSGNVPRFGDAIATCHAIVDEHDGHDEHDASKLVLRRSLDSHLTR